MLLQATLTVMHFDDSDCSSCSSYYCARCQAVHAYPPVPVQPTHGSQMICIHPSCAWTSAPLPCDSVAWNMFSHAGYLEFNALYYLTVKRVINWCPSLSPLYPILTAGMLLLFGFCCSFLVQYVQSLQCGHVSFTAVILSSVLLLQHRNFT